MTRIIAVPHSVPVRFVPRRGTTVRADWIRETTNVELREAAPDAFAPVATLASGRFFDHEGELWMLLDAAESTELPPDPVPPGVLAESLQRPDERDGMPACLVRSLERTPLASLSGGEVASGDLSGIGPVRHLVEDGTERAVAGLHAMFARGIRTAGDRAYMRALGPMWARQVEWMPSTYHPSASPAHDVREGFVARFDRPEDLWRFDDALAHARGGTANARRNLFHRKHGDVLDRAVVPARYLRDDDVRLFANAAPGRLLRLVDAALDRARADGRAAALETLGDRLDRLRAHAPWGEIGGIEDGEAVARLVQGLAADFLRARITHGSERELALRLRVYAETVAIPRYEERALGMADADALTGLCP